MTIDRRLLHSRHEFRFGTRELVMGGAGLLLVCALTFVSGVLVGRELSSSSSDASRRGSGGAPAAPGPASAASLPAKKPERAPAEERLTFYQTLTAPTADLPPAGPPSVEERLVPRETPAPPGASGASAPERGAAALAPARPGPRVRREPAPIAPPATAAPAPAAGEARLWTVQVSSFRSRALADELLTRLAGKGFDAYLVSVTTEEGRVRHRVRVGEYATRVEAERMAAELRAERNLSPFVTTRTR